MAIDVDTLRTLQEPAEVAALDLSWLNLEGQWGVQVRPGRRGLTLQDIAIGPEGSGADRTGNGGLRLVRAGALTVRHTGPAW